MCVILKALVSYKGCTKPDGANHILSIGRVITREQPDMSADIIAKLDCKNDKMMTPGCWDAVCTNVTECGVPFGSTSKKGRCSACLQLGLYEGNPECLTEIIERTDIEKIHLVSQDCVGIKGLSKMIH